MEKIKVDNICVGIEHIIEFNDEGYSNSENLCILEKTESFLESKHILLTVYKNISNNKFLYLSKDGIVLPKKDENIYTIENIKTLTQILKEYKKKKSLLGDLLENIDYIYKFVISKIKKHKDKEIDLLELKDMIDCLEILYIASLENAEIEFEQEESAEEKRSRFYLIRKDTKN